MAGFIDVRHVLRDPWYAWAISVKMSQNLGSSVDTGVRPGLARPTGLARDLLSTSFDIINITDFQPNQSQQSPGGIVSPSGALLF